MHKTYVPMSLLSNLIDISALHSFTHIVNVSLKNSNHSFQFQVYASMSPIVHIVNVGSAETESLANVTVRTCDYTLCLLVFKFGLNFNSVKVLFFFYIPNEYNRLHQIIQDQIFIDVSQ